MEEYGKYEYIVPRWRLAYRTWWGHLPWASMQRRAKTGPRFPTSMYGYRYNKETKRFSIDEEEQAEIKVYASLLKDGYTPSEIGTMREKTDFVPSQRTRRRCDAIMRNYRIYAGWHISVDEDGEVIFPKLLEDSEI